MRCRSVRRKLNAYLDCEAPPALQARIEAHVRSCSACRQALAALRTVCGEMGHPPEPPPLAGDFAARVVQQAAERRERPAPALPEHVAPSPALRWAAAAMFAAGLALGAMMARDLVLDPGPAVSAEQAALEVGFDSLTEAPQGSLARAYLDLASGLPEGEE